MMAKPSRLVSKSVPAPMNRVLGETSKARPSHQDNPGQGKTGRVNASEPLTRLRERRSHRTDG
ncbi:MAG: hypothetical protein NVS4B2_35310 [Chloroflexota bacterium]